MSSGSNPPLPGDGIAPQRSLESVTPVFNRVGPELPPSPSTAEPHFNYAAQDAPKVEHPNTPALIHEMKGPDGTSIRQGAAEDKRQAAMDARMAKVVSQIEKDGGQKRDPIQLKHEFDRADDRR